jgi:hypothetical protein
MRLSPDFTKFQTSLIFSAIAGVGIDLVMKRIFSEDIGSAIM